MKDKIFGLLQRIGRSFMLPIAMLPVAGLCLGLGRSMTNLTMLNSYGLMKIMGPGTIIYGLFKILCAAGEIIFNNLPLIFAIGVAVGMAKKEKEVAALSSAVAFLVMHSAISAMITISGGKIVTSSTDTVLGIKTLQMGVFGGIIVGLGVAALHNRFHKIELPQALSFFGGTRFVPIISCVTYLLVGIAMFYVWPPFQNAITSIAGLVRDSGYVGTFIYGLVERALIPFGIHHVFYLPFWQTSVGGNMIVSGQYVQGAQNIFFAQLAQSRISHFSVEATRFMSGKYPFMMFGLPGAALAMIKCAKPEKRKQVTGLLLSAALTSFMTGITEPIEFTFLFAAPVLYVVHCIFAGLSYMLMHILNVAVGMTFSGGLVDLTLFGILQGNDKTDWVYIVIVGVAYFFLYYFTFTFLIKKFNFKTPGRDDSMEIALKTEIDMKDVLKTKKEKEREEEQRKNEKLKKQEMQIQTLNEADPVSALLVAGLGGKSNISDLDCCATRLRITVENGDKVDKNMLQDSGAAGVIVKGVGVQVVFGPKVTVVKSNLEDYLNQMDIILKEVLEDDKKEEEQPALEKQPIKKVSTLPDKDKLSKILAPLSGKIIPLADLNDGAFSEGMLGEGIAIEPTSGKAYSPVNGTIMSIFDTKHAIAIEGDDGVEILLHIGIDTVELNGRYFEMHVEEGQKVTTGDLLVSFDIPGICSEGYRVTTPIVITNTENFKQVIKTKAESVYTFDSILEVEK